MLKTVQLAARSTVHDPATIAHAYHFSKNMCAAAINDSMKKSYGVREEHRVTITLAQAMQAELARRNLLNVAFAEPPKALRPYHILPSALFLNFLYSNIKKFAAGFETVYTMCDRRFVNWEQTKIMVMFLRLLSYSYGSGALEREPALWADVRSPLDPVPEDDDPEKVEGMGLKHTMEAYGYGWIMDKVDWNAWAFDGEHTDNVSFGNPHIFTSYRQRYGQVRSVYEKFVWLDRSRRHLREYRAYPSIVRHITKSFAVLCLRQYMQDCWNAMSSELRPTHKEQALDGRIPLDLHSLQQALRDECLPPHIVKSRILQSPEALAEFLWDDNDPGAKTLGQPRLSHAVPQILRRYREHNWARLKTEFRAAR